MALDASDGFGFGHATMLDHAGNLLLFGSLNRDHGVERVIHVCLDKKRHYVDDDL